MLEPAQGLAYKTARKGVGHWDLQVEGVAAHAGVDFAAGHSAIRAMAALVEELSNWTDLERGLTVNVGTIAGGSRSNVVPALCRAAVDARVVTLADAAEVQARFAALTVPEPCRLRVTGGINRPPMERGEGTVRLLRQAQALASELGCRLDEAATGGGSDGNFTAALGVPTLDGMGGRRRRRACGARACPAGTLGGAHRAAGRHDRKRGVRCRACISTMQYE